MKVKKIKPHKLIKDEPMYKTADLISAIFTYRNNEYVYVGFRQLKNRRGRCKEYLLGLPIDNENVVLAVVGKGYNLAVNVVPSYEHGFGKSKLNDFWTVGFKDHTENKTKFIFRNELQLHFFEKFGREVLFRSESRALWKALKEMGFEEHEWSE